MLNIGKALFEKEAMAKIIAIALLLLFFVFSFTFFLHLYAKCYLRPEQPPTTTAVTTVAVRRRRRLHRLHFSQASRHGLDPTVLNSIPILSFTAGVHEKGMECAVCLSEVTEGETFRLLPKCDHGFHVDCIDMWFQSHSTCPLCRNPVSDQFPKLPSETSLNTILETARGENARFPTNVLFWGNEAQVSTRALNADEEDDAVTRTEEELEATSSSGMLAIDMPRQAVIEEEDEEQSATVTTRLRSLKRLLGRDSRVNPCRPSADATLP